MEVQFGPNAVDDSNLLYKLQRKLKVFNTSNSLPNRGYNLLSTSSKYGVVFVAAPQGVLSVYDIKDLINNENEAKHLTINLQVQPTHIAVNADQEWLAVVGGQMLFVYKITDFQNPGVGPSVSIRFEVNPSTFLSSLQWNPCIPDTIALVYFDGTLIVCQVNTMQKKQIQSIARCLCWSPKGKQLVTGNSDGTLCQFKPDLSPMKSVPAPNLFEGAPVEALAIYWISTFQFAVVFRNASDNSRPAVTIVNTPKGGTPTCLNYEDICYSMGSNRPWYYYLQGLAQWNIIMSSSSNSMEIATIGSKDGVSWVQWCQNDEARPELPLTDKKQENYPVGVCVDTCAAHQLPWGENEVLPPMPFLLVVSQTGLLTIFNIINLDKSAAQICTPKQTLSLPEVALTSEIPDDVPQQPAAPTQTMPIVQQPQPVVQQPQPVAQQPQPFAQQPQPVAQQPQPVAQQPQPVGQQQQSVIQQLLRQQTQLPKAEPPSSAPSLFGAQKQSTPPATSAAPIVQVDTKVAAQVEKSTAEASALKIEQERANKAKVDQELKNILIKEVNDFQLELHKFRVITNENQIKIHQQIISAKPNMELHTMDAEQLKRECSMEELRESIIQLKLELVRACAVVAEARTHAEAKELHEWSQADPLTTKRFASIKNLAYYVQNQLNQAQKELDYKWDEMITKSQYVKPGQRMIRPILDDVYQPLVKQQEILSRQQAVLKTLRNTLNECSTTPMFKSTSLLRSTPFKNKDPLSKLTKNILNMSIEPQHDNKDKELSSQKLDALRDMLSNHRPKKIKPVSVELRQHLEAMKKKYEKGVKDRAEKRDIVKQIEQQKMEQIRFEVEKQEKLRLEAEKHEQIKIKAEIEIMRIEAAKEEQRRIEAEKRKQLDKTKPQIKTEFPQSAPQINTFVKTESKPNIIKESPITVPTFTPANNLKPSIPPFASVAKSLFNEDTKQEVFAPKPQASGQAIKTEAKDRSLQDYLQSDNLLQNICSPTAFSSPKTTTTSAATTVFSSKPIADMTNMFSKFTQPTPETKASSKPNATSDETGEIESNTRPIKPVSQPVKENKPLQNMFSLKNAIPKSNVHNVPDVLKGNQVVAFGKTELTPKTTDKETEGSKENVPQTSEVNISTVKKDELKPFSIQSVNSPPSLSPAQQVFVVDLKKPNELKIEKSLPASFYASTVATSASTNQSITISQVSAAVPTKPDTSTIEPLKEPTSTSNVTSQSETIKTENDTEKSKITKSETTVSTTEASSVTISLTTSKSPTEPSSTVAKSVFSSAAQSLFSSPTTPEGSKPLFGSSSVSITPLSPDKTTTSSTTFGSQPLFGNAVLASTTTTQNFGTATTASAFSTSAQSVFSAANKTAFGSPTTTAQSIFGATTQAPTFGGPAFSSSQSVFGTTSTPSSVFGAAVQSAFGQTTQAGFGTSTTQSLFGTSTSATPSVFAATTTTQSVFGSATSPATVFGGAASQPSVFGSNAQPAFGSASPTQSVFGSASTTQASVFGTSTETQSGSLFGDGGASMFASASIGTTSSPSQSGGSLFGGSSGFGSTNTNVFGAKSTFSGSNPTAANIFGGGASFGQKPATDFWGGGNTASTGFGSSGGFGQPASTQASVFGSSGGSFSQPSTGQPFGSPPTPSVFGSPQQQTAPAFGGSPVFGSKPAFGSPPSFGGSAFGGVNKSPSSGFGSSATFGGGAAFGGTAFGNTSPGKVFGGASPSFGSPTQSNATFENLATQNTLTFGNLAQQSGQQATPPPSFNTSPSFTGWRG